MPPLREAIEVISITEVSSSHRSGKSSPRAFALMGAMLRVADLERYVRFHSLRLRFMRC